MSPIFEIIGYIAGTCTAICFLPQTIKTIRSKQVRDLSLFSYALYCVGVCCWIAYGLYLKSAQIVIFNVLTLLVTSPIVYMILTSRKDKNG